MAWKNKIFETIAKPYWKAFQRANRLNVGLFEKSEPVYRHPLPNGELAISCPTRVALWRAQTLLTKEPGTIEWIDSFRAGELFFDIGANIGLYSLYAAYRGIHCFAFEPESQNYALLNRNIYLNSFGDKISALNIALSSDSKIDFLNLRNFVAGAALHNFGSAIDYNKKAFKAVFQQGVCSSSIDGLIAQYGLAVPAHIKIDVDGLEWEILNGAKSTLADPRLKSLQIELNLTIKADLDIKSILEKNGFTCTNQRQAAELDKNSFTQVFNFTFRRE